jgi:transposase
MRKRAERLAHLQNTHSQYNRPECGQQLAYKANREGVAEHCPEPSVRKTIELEVALINPYDTRLGEGALSITRTARGHAVQSCSRLQSVPGIGQILALVILYELQDSARCPRVQDFLSYCRLVKCTKESAGKRPGLSGKTLGNPQRKWAFSEAATLFLRPNHLGKEDFAKLEHNHGQGKALTVLAQKLARAVSCMLTRHQAFAVQRFVTA